MISYRLIWINQGRLVSAYQFSSSVSTPRWKWVLKVPQGSTEVKGRHPLVAAFSFDAGEGVGNGGNSAIMLTDHLCDTGGTLPPFDLNSHLVGDAQRVRRHILCRRDGDTPSQT